jgi:CRISPR-associated protein Csx10
VVTLTTGGAVPAGILAAVQRDGIGERTAEGFGQVRFDAAEVTAAGPRLQPAGARRGMRAAGGDDGGLPPAPDVLEEAAVRAEIARQVPVLLAQGPDRVIPGAAGVRSRAQWGSLRQQLPRLRSAGGREAVARWLEKTGLVRQRREAWGEPALRALERLLSEEMAVWADLGLSGEALDGLVLAADRAGAVRTALWADAVTALLTDTAREATRRLQQAQEAEERG